LAALVYVAALDVLSVFVPTSADTIDVDTSATGNDDGSSWIDAYVDLHDARTS
jgi:hypothetical protein